ncbi:hypothetical protein [Plantactinospora mayteni]|uniref:hypothetical protein n=1 Tax=Plantactinospora mayteni TaxID=566021 RepID=UPI0031EBAEE4
MNYEAGGLRADGSYDLAPLVRAFLDDPTPDLIMLCEAEFWHACGKRPFHAAMKDLGVLTGRPYVGGLFTGPLGTAVIYDPIVLCLDAGASAAPSTSIPEPQPAPATPRRTGNRTPIRMPASTTQPTRHTTAEVNPPEYPIDQGQFLSGIAYYARPARKRGRQQRPRRPACPATASRHPAIPTRDTHE